MASSQLIGSRISLISKKDIRYEGTLYMIDATNASVTLQNVKSWGTEDRLPDEVVPPTDELFSCIVFRGADIKDLHVHDGSGYSKSEVEESPSPLAPETPPSIAPSSKQSQPIKQPMEQKPQDEKPERTEVEPKKKVSSIKPERYQPPHKNPNYKGNRGGSNRDSNREASDPSSIPGMGNHLASRRTKGGGGISVDKDAFDIQAALDQFDKDALKEEAMESENGYDISATPVKKYNKSSFFDEISCDATDGRHRISGHAERSLNSETFGATSVAFGGNRNNRGRGRGSYRGRGGPFRKYNNNDRRDSQDT